MIYHVAATAAEAQAIRGAYTELGKATKKIKLADTWLVMAA